MSDTERGAASAAVCRRLRERILTGARTILFYAPLPLEVDVWPLVSDALGAGLRVALPRFDAPTRRYQPVVVADLVADIVPGKFGIREPGAHCLPLTAPPDWILVPGLAFDRFGRRLGRGRGFYDLLLAEVPGRRCGVAFDQQVLDALPIEPHDLQMHALATPTRWVRVEAV